MNATIGWNVTCNPQISRTSAYFAVVPAVQVIINAVIAIAALRHRSKLRNNFVYAYVISLMVANVVFGIFSILGLVSRGLAIEAIYHPVETHKILHGDPSHEHLKRWWAFRSSFNICIYLVMSSSVSSLIYGIRESSYFIGPGVRRRRLASDSSSENSTRLKRNIAFFLIAVGWVGPFILSIAAVAGWNCGGTCSCFSGYYGQSVNLCHSDVLIHCSGLHPPLSQSFVVTCIVLWFVLTFGILLILSLTVRKYRQITKPSTTATVTHRPSQINSPNDSASENENPNNNLEAIKPKKTSWKRSVVRCLKFRNYNVTIKLMLLISLLFVLGSAPTIVVIIIDVASNGQEIPLALVLSAYAISMFYCIISPLILCYYMSGLRAAVLNLFTTCCTKTVVRRPSMQPNLHISLNSRDLANN